MRSLGMLVVPPDRPHFALTPPWAFSYAFQGISFQKNEQKSDWFLEVSASCAGTGGRLTFFATR